MKWLMAITLLNGILNSAMAVKSAKIDSTMAEEIKSCVRPGKRFRMESICRAVEVLKFSEKTVSFCDHTISRSIPIVIDR